MKFVLTFLLSLLLPNLALAQDAPAPELAAKAYLLYDYTSGQFLLEQNGNERMEPASLTKLMTAYLVFHAIREHKFSLTQTIHPSADAVHSESDESRMFLQHDKPVSVDEMLHGLIIDSGNDAARELGLLVSGSEAAFADQMNQEAQRLGMHDTHFVNPTGLPDPQHYTTAHDLALLAAAITRDFPEFYPIYGQREYQYNGIKQYNRNRLLWDDPYVDGMKTGHTESAGFCLVTSAKRDNRRLIAVVLGTATNSLRASESQKLLNYGFQNFEAVRLYQKDQPVTAIRLWKGTENRLQVGFRRDLFLTIPKGMMAQLKATMETRQPLTAPITSGQKIGLLKVTLDGKPYGEFPLVALENVQLANVFSRGLDSIRLLFQ
ncbi:MAG: D-alanyl-D-alanine carboxypeptidase [Sideroxydans sp.]|nr:D-alanyl-D-alanine carboxypeptidase [Sideroxydans sp.]